MIYSKKDLRCEIIKTCPICDEKGTMLYKGLEESFTEIKGPWAHMKCNSPSCGVIWLYEKPIDEDLWKMYTKYTTHHTPTAIYKKSDTLYTKIKDLIFEKKLGYPAKKQSFILHILASLLQTLHPGLIDRLIASRFYIPYVKNGKILDVGCGNGSSLLLMQTYGWHGTGIDFDEQAIKNARAANIDARVGDIYTQSFPEYSYDAILLNHVIEHVPNPKQFLAECARILKPGGTLVAITPNANSFGSKIFKEHWRGLEYPNHLQVFTPKSLEKITKDLPVKYVTVTGSLQGEIYILTSSYQKRFYGKEKATSKNLFPRIVQELLFYVVGLVHAIAPKNDEVLYLKITK